MRDHHGAARCPLSVAVAAAATLPWGQSEVKLLLSTALHILGDVLAPVLLHAPRPALMPPAAYTGQARLAVLLLGKQDTGASCATSHTLTMSASMSFIIALKASSS